MLQETASDLKDRAYAPTLTVLRTGSPYLLEECDPSGLALFLAGAELTDEQKEAVRDMQPRSYLAVPLVHRGRCLGVISMLYSAVSDRRYDGGDLAWAQQLADGATQQATSIAGAAQSLATLEASRTALAAR
jgi:GAF domain-containing protein